MKAITIPAYNRPQYLRRTLDSIKAADPSGWKLFIGVEPTNPEVVSICKSIRFMPCDVVVNKTCLGPNKNPRDTFLRAFGAGADFVLGLQDDVVLSLDALRMAEWFFLHPKRDKYSLLVLLNLPWINSADTAKPSVVYESGNVRGAWVPFFDPAPPFSCQAFCMTRSRWDSVIRPCCHVSAPKIYDMEIARALAADPTGKMLFPALSRTRHIGDETSLPVTGPSRGIVKHAFRNQQWYQGPVGLRYSIERYPGHGVRK